MVDIVISDFLVGDDSGGLRKTKSHYELIFHEIFADLGVQNTLLRFHYNSTKLNNI